VPQATPRAPQQPQQAQQAQQAQQTPQPFIVTVGPKTGDEVQALRIRLDDLREELQDAASRRRTVADQLRSADSRAVPGLEERLGVLDARVVRIERDISLTGEQLRNASPIALVEARRQSPDPAAIAERVSGDLVPIVAIISVFFLAPLAMAIARFIWKRSTAPVRPAMVDQASQQRLEQLQQAVDTIAIEVERISEGQRFVTKLLSERERPAIGAPVERR
jgi:hypothetical protein